MSLRYARVGKLDESGQLPAGWNVENLSDVEIVDIDLQPQAPSLSCTFKISPDLPGEYAGLTLGNYATIEHDEPFALVANIDISQSEGIIEAYLLIREWVGGAEYIGQATRLVERSHEAGATVVVRTGRANGHVVQPALALRRASGAGATGTVTIHKLTFCSLYQHPGWLAG